MSKTFNENVLWAWVLDCFQWKLNSQGYLIVHMWLNNVYFGIFSIPDW